MSILDWMKRLFNIWKIFSSIYVFKYLSNYKTWNSPLFFLFNLIWKNKLKELLRPEMLKPKKQTQNMLITKCKSVLWMAMKAESLALLRPIMIRTKVRFQWGSNTKINVKFVKQNRHILIFLSTLLIFK